VKATLFYLKSARRSLALVIINIYFLILIHLDKVFDQSGNNQDVFSLLRENIKNIFNGINMTVFVYGQTSTGKTFTMRGNEANPGTICEGDILCNREREGY
jgi:Kinesin motor domain